MTAASSASFDADGHPEVADISALTEGLLSPAHSARVRAHLSECAVCSDVQVSLEEIRSALGTLPGPIRMPADIAGRIDAALAAEALLDATAPAGASHSEPEEGFASAPPAQSAAAEEAAGVSRETPVRLDRAGVSRETPATPLPSLPTAVSRETVGGRRPPGCLLTASGPGKPPGGGRRRLRRRRAVWLGATVAAAGAVFSALVVPQWAGHDGASPTQASPQRSGRSGADLAGGRLEAHVRSLLPRGKEAVPGAESSGEVREFSAGTVSGASPRSAPPAIPLCVRRGIDRDEPPLAVDTAVYGGRRSYVVVLPHASDGGRVDAYVVDAACTKEATPATGTVLTEGTYTLP